MTGFCMTIIIVFSAYTVLNSSNQSQVTFDKVGNYKKDLFLFS